MATIKSYTDLSQSKVLAEILPLESADMWFHPYPNDEDWYDIPAVGKAEFKYNELPCWSLAALLNTIPKRIDEYNVLRIDISANDFAIWYDEVGCGANDELPDITKESAVDACYEFILKLHKLNLL